MNGWSRVLRRGLAVAALALSPHLIGLAQKRSPLEAVEMNLERLTSGQRKFQGDANPPANQKKEAAAPSASEGRERRGAQPPLPAKYHLIVERNLFRRLGWTPPAPPNPFALMGIVDDGRRKRALLARQGSGMGVYATVGEEVGFGYRIAAIDAHSVRLTGGALGSVTCELNRDAIGMAGGTPSPSPPPAPTKTKEATPAKKKYYPPRGARFENVVREILEREGISWEEIEKNKDLQQKLRSKYQYLEDEGYVTFPKD